MKENYKKKGYLLEDFRLFHLRDCTNSDVEYHYHEFYKLLFLRSGNGSYFVEGKRYVLKPGDIILVGKHCIHRPEFEKTLPYERVVIYISPEFLYRQSTPDCDLSLLFSEDAGPVLRPDGNCQNTLFSLAEALEQTLSTPGYGRELLSNSMLLRLLVELGRTMQQQTVQTPAPLLPKSKRILEIVRYLDAHLTEDVCIDDLAEKFYLSRYHMMRRFKEETGTTIHNYLSDRRLLLGRDYISQGISATEACFLCGFQSYASFSRAYGKLFGTTPTGRKVASVAMEETFE